MAFIIVIGIFLEVFNKNIHPTLAPLKSILSRVEWDWNTAGQIDRPLPASYSPHEIFATLQLKATDLGKPDLCTQTPQQLSSLSTGCSPAVAINQMQNNRPQSILRNSTQFRRTTFTRPNNSRPQNGSNGSGLLFGPPHDRSQSRVNEMTADDSTGEDQDPAATDNAMLIREIQNSTACYLCGEEGHRFAQCPLSSRIHGDSQAGSTVRTLLGSSSRQDNSNIRQVHFEDEQPAEETPADQDDSPDQAAESEQDEDGSLPSVLPGFP
jgi:hypothetical protein